MWLLVIQKYFNPAVREICYFDILGLLSKQYKVGIFFRYPLNTNCHSCQFISFHQLHLFHGLLAKPKIL